MRARLKPSAIVSKRQKEAFKEYTQKQNEGNMRRTFKLMCLALHEEFGFGRDRCLRLMGSISKLANEHETDEVYWTHVDRVMEQIGLDFIKEDYDVVDR